MLTDEAGQPLTGLASVIFALYQNPTGGVPLWVEILVVQADTNGRFLALLGSTMALPTDLFASRDARWLSIQPEGQPEQPRVQFLSVPYALKASDADTIGGRPLSAFVLSDNLETALAKTSFGNTSFGATTNGLSSSGVVNGLDGSFDDVTITGNSLMGGHVGIGTTSANVLGSTKALTIKGATQPRIELIGTRTGTDTTGDIVFINETPGGTYNALGAIRAVRTDANNTGALAFVTSQDGGFAEGMRLDGSGNLGIGTRSPNVTKSTRSLTIKGATQPRIEVIGTRTADDTVGEMLFINETPASTYNQLAVFRVMRVGANNSGELAVLTSSAGTMVEAMRIDAAGNVGIGTSAPAAKLQVEGDMVVSGNIAAKYQDVAEWVDAVGVLAPGTVVAADPLGRNRVRESNGSYDTKVLGAVSRQPGVVLGEPGPNRVLVAQSGRVLVKVDARYGAIASGDLLSTSPTPGHAMRSAPLHLDGVPLHRPGTVLGKALEPLDLGQGEILVLLTLQ